MEADNNRLSAYQIYDRVVSDARSELDRPPKGLAFSALASGLLMGLTGLGVAGTLALLHGPAAHFIALLFYPMGFIAVVIGRAQLFTENTLYPVVLVLEDRRHVVPTLRLWVVVFSANVLGALAFAALATWTGALAPAVLTQLIQLGVTAAAVPPLHVFAGGILGGWMVALMAWLVSGAKDTIGQVAVIWMMTFLVGLLHLAHCIASSGYILAAVLSGDVSVPTYAAWLALATVGNIIGGVFIVSLLNYGQVRAGAHARERVMQAAQR
jgi:formate-nitrite transporter family protein